jgi:hypothetical protein
MTSPTYCSLYVFHHHLSILQASPDDGLAESTHVVSQIIKTFVWLTPPFLWVKLSEHTYQWNLCKFWGDLLRFEFKGSYIFSNTYEVSILAGL